jgi:hypothetical protein
LVSDNFRNSGFRFKELIMSLVVLREFPSAGAQQNTQSRGAVERVADNNSPR